MFDQTAYDKKIEALFVRFPSVQKTGFGDAYKPGLGNMSRFDEALGYPSRAFRTIHVAGTNGKGSVSNMLASALSAKGLKVGLYTSPHLLDFRERMMVTGEGMITKEGVWDFLEKYEGICDEMDLSFFEITTGMAFDWFRQRGVDVAVVEVGLGGRLDSTNIITPELSVITSIGLDHCAMLGDTREAIAGEKAGIFKPGVPAVVGTWDEQTAPVFEQVAAQSHSPLTFADRVEPALWSRADEILAAMDLQGPCQRENLRTALVALESIGIDTDETMQDAIVHTARRMDFHGRWEMLSREPDVICDIGHNPPALKVNFARLEQYLADGTYDKLIMVYGVMADKDLDGIIPMMPAKASYIFVTPDTRRAMPAEQILQAVSQAREGHLTLGGDVKSGVRIALSRAQKALSAGRKPLIYIGGSTFVVCEAITLF
ncbi:MAG: bifunctional folylpolyglutamate synthase/dihydrofolate synthase [Bacteroidales bacterium]|nr:bifunctional folylpolyglutamate synthase/dihydrofolate synthase [Bacteroidales bacterium]